MPKLPNDLLSMAQRLRHHPSRWKRWLAMAAGLLAVTASFFLGVFVIIIATGLFTVVGIIFAIRIWWLQRSRRAAAGGVARTSTTETHYRKISGSGRIIEGESVDITDRK